LQYKKKLKVYGRNTSSPQQGEISFDISWGGKCKKLNGKRGKMRTKKEGKGQIWESVT
jgi:hypothetical protein